MGRHLRSRVGHPLYGGCCISHAGIMQHQHGDCQLPLIEIGRGRVDHTESLGNGIWPAPRMVTIATPPTTIPPPTTLLPVPRVPQPTPQPPPPPPPPPNPPPPPP